MDLYQAEAARGWHKWIYIRQRQPGVGINGFISRGSPGWYKWIYIRQRQPGVGINGFSYQAEAARGWYKWIYIRQRQPGVGINGFISGRGSPGLV